MFTWLKDVVNYLKNGTIDDVMFDEVVVSPVITPIVEKPKRKKAVKKVVAPVVIATKAKKAKKVVDAAKVEEVIIAAKAKRTPKNKVK